MDLTKLHLHWRVSYHNGKSYRSYSLARAYRENGKQRKEIVLKLGKLSDGEVAKWRNVLQLFKKPDTFLTTLSDLVVTDRYSYLDIAAVNLAWNELKLDKIFKDGKREIGIGTIARILTINRCVEPRSKFQTPDWFQTTTLPWLLDVDSALINVSRIFRELTAIEEHKEAICDYLFRRLLSESNVQSMKNVFYDLSSATFSGCRCVMMKWGHCKEGYFKHVVLQHSGHFS
jgi:hypothetical protein